MDGGAWAMFMLVILSLSYGMVEGHGWVPGISVFVLQTAVLILAVKLGDARSEVESLSLLLKHEREQLWAWREYYKRGEGGGRLGTNVLDRDSLRWARFVCEVKKPE